ncbi:MAG: hypothetical protein AB9M60_11820, partial [Leptothrix sp. (in: b-proteobacteria)]
ATGKTANHIPIATVSGVGNASCDSCHKAGFTAWTPSRFHTSFSVSAQCATCHTGSFPPAVGKPNTPVHNGVTVCETCHKSTATWTGGSTKVDHSTFTTATNCASCHNGSTATGKSAAHIPTGTAGCLSCHTTTGWVPTRFNHTQVTAAGACSSCHSGSYPPADGKPATHIPYASVTGMSSANCDGCHKAGYTAWTPAKLHSSYTVSAQCATCHNGSFAPAVGKPNTPVHTGATVCETCHKSTATWTGGSTKVDHSTFTTATNCASCHNGSTATGKPTTHIPTSTAGCLSCHTTTAWTPTRFNHTQVTVAGQCATCHSGNYPPADGKPVLHVPYTAISGISSTSCDTCHKAGYAAWTPARLHTSVVVSAQCALCHSGSYPPAVGKPNTPTHAGVTICENCHRSTTSWTSGASFTHSAANAVGTGTCDACHTGAGGVTGKPATHIPVTTGATKCDSCHRSQTSFATSVTMNHGVVTASTCKSCHSGAYTSQGTTGALAKPTNHIPEAQLLNGAAMDCKSCHTSTASWTSVRMEHNASLGGGAGWCKGCHATGTSYLGSMDKKALTHQKKTPAAIDCSESGCHRPLGNKGAAYSKWN